MKFSQLFVTASLSVGGWASTAERHGWKQVGRAAPHDRIDLHVALKPAKSWAEIEKLALDIATPSHANFRKHLSRSEVSALSAPSIEAEEAVKAWLASYNITGTIRGGILEASTSVKAVQDLLQAQYHRYFQSGESVLRTEEVHIPDEILEHIEFITPTSQWPFRSSERTELRKRGVAEQLAPATPVLKRDDSCGSDDYVTPSCLKQVYNISYTPQPNRTTFAVYGTEAASFSASNLKDFLEDYNPPAASASASFTVVGDGDPEEGDGGVGSSFETALDTQTLMGLAWPASGILYNNGGVFGPNATEGKTYDRFVNFLQDLIHNDTVPSVVSFSESTPEDIMDPAYAQRLCSMMSQVGTRGVTLVFSSGDNGPQGDTSTGEHKKTFETEFPASCPWVTAIGGTVDLANEVGATQSSLKGTGVGNLGYTSSGGGFSNLFARPDYQDGFVDSYISKNVPSTYEGKSGYNSSGRGVPDVSAFSSNLPVVQLGITIGIGGTSGATPIWAGVVAILNDYLASQGKPPLGFLNPWLYSLKSGEIKDITGGGDNVGGCSIGCDLDETLGYNVTAGWDAVTGLGSPNVGLLLRALGDTSA